jgi:hypothetical protein
VFTFLNQIFLAGLAAAALPILIHLFSRRRAKEVPFASLEYLQEISRQKVRRMRLRQLLLLALRVLVVALFALAMGRPAIRGSAGVVTRGSSTLAVVLDNSYSMNAVDPRLTGKGGRPGGSSADPGETGASPVDEEGTVFALAKERALEVLDLMGEGDRGFLALAGRPATIPFQTVVADAGLLRQEVRRASLAAGGSDLPTALAQVLPLLESARTLNKELYVISDFQKRDLDGWLQANAPGGATAWTDGSGAPVRIPPGVLVYLVPVRTEGASNASLGRIRFDASSGLARAGRLTVTVINHGGDPVTERVVRAASAVGTHDILGDALLDLPPRGEGEAAVDLSAPPSEGAVEVRIGSDALEWDNTGYLITGDPGVRRVLLVTGGAPDESRFLRTALDPEGTGEFFAVREATPEELAQAQDWSADVVILSNVGRLSASAVENLMRFRARGGGLLIGLGDRIDPRYYNTEILKRLSSVELLNVAVEEGPGTFRSLRPVVLTHPVFSGFPIGPGDDLGSARFRKLVTCRTGQEARVLAEFGRAYPALIEESGMLLFTSSLDGQWNDFVLSASYPPLLHMMVRYLAGRGGAEREGLVGSRLETLLPETEVDGAVVCIDPLGTQTAVEVSPAERMLRLRSEPTPWPGIYRFDDASGGTLARFAVNLDPAEGDLEVAPPDVQARLFGKDAKRIEPGQAITRDLLAGRYGRELWRPLLVAVLLLLAVESVLGRGRLLG